MLKELARWRELSHCLSDCRGTIHLPAEDARRLNSAHAAREMFLKNVPRILVTQCHSNLVVRTKRAQHVCGLVGGVCSPATINSTYGFLLLNLRKAAESWSRRRTLRVRHVAYLLSASVFYWNNDGVSDEELKNSIKEFWRTSKSTEKNKSLDGGSSGKGCKQSTKTANALLVEGWEPVILNDNYQVWRKWLEKGLYQYKVFGTFRDIPAKAFFVAQYDTNVRKEWDKLVIELNVVDKERKESRPLPETCDTGNEVLYWAMHYPFPMYGRDYCYVRRAIIDKRSNMLVLISRAVKHPNCPPSNSYVRVEEYKSEMVIRPHKSFEENGFDYLLTYFDDPKSAFPSPAYNWMACSGVPDFVDKLHKAALNLHSGKLCKIDSKSSWSQPYNSPAANNKSRDWAYA